MFLTEFADGVSDGAVSTPQSSQSQVSPQSSPILQTKFAEYVKQHDNGFTHHEGVEWEQHVKTAQIRVGVAKVQEYFQAQHIAIDPPSGADISRRDRGELIGIGDNIISDDQRDALAACAHHECLEILSDANGGVTIVYFFGVIINTSVFCLRTFNLSLVVRKGLEPQNKRSTFLPGDELWTNKRKPKKC